ncbi:hypothetical protein ACP3V3_16925 [Vibrio sp. PNB22_3_1]
MNGNFLKDTLRCRRAQLAREAILELQDKAEYLTVIKDPQYITEELNNVFSAEKITETHQRFLTTGYPFRFCHLLLMAYYIAFKEHDTLHSEIDEPETWPAVVPIDYILTIVDKASLEQTDILTIN